jgi:HD-GYP domain-containing protein (c-di-GMP phosphodiesterase class II)
MRYLLLSPAGLSLDAIAPALEADDVVVRVVSSGDTIQVGKAPTVLLLGAANRTSFDLNQLRGFVSADGAIVTLGAEGEHDVPDELPEDLLAAFVPTPHGIRQLLVALRSAFREAAARRDSLHARGEATTRTKELGELTRIGMALATERDYNTLLQLILSQAQEITGSDAGSLYLVEKKNEAEDGERILHFTLAQTFSRPDIPFVTHTIPIDRSSIAGYVATTGEPLVLDDAYELPEGVEYSINRSFDETYGYRTQSMLTIPMKDHKDEVIGVLQLINRKRHPTAKLHSASDFEREVVPYSRRLVELVSALAGQAAVSIENSRLYEDIERLFEGFVRAAVTAIEQRDPTTFGHSGRVASMTVGLAEVVDRAGGQYRDVCFTRQEIREIRYAGLLHDFGKVGVREQVLVKAKKLQPQELALIRLRHGFIRRTAEQEFYRQRVEHLERHGQEGYEAFLQQLDKEHRRQLEELDKFLKIVVDANEPTLLPAGTFEDLLRYAERAYQDLDGKERPFLTDDEIRFLTIRKGSLDEAERVEIESHVTHTYRFLRQIPWTKELQDIPLIAFGHHEKLDGSGYPRQVTGNEIPIQTRMMTIADIYDALTASDRPYKRAVPADRALDIIGSEVEGGMLDSNLARLFVDAKVFERRDD